VVEDPLKWRPEYRISSSMAAVSRSSPHGVVRVSWAVRFTWRYDQFLAWEDRVLCIVA
jgi:hypothetical protein